MKERPILFSAPMVRALLGGTKTQTRRIVKTEVALGREALFAPRGSNKHAPTFLLPDAADLAVGYCPYGRPGDLLWVRETFSPVPMVWTEGGVDHRSDFAYLATGDIIGCHKWRPSVHMPRSASRITLEITGVRVERLQDISEADALAEGVFKKIGSSPGGEMDIVETATGSTLYYAAPTQAREEFRHLWGQINGHDSWTENPWVWIVEFRRIKS